MVSITTTLEKFESNLWEYHLPIPKEIANKFIEGTNRRIICTINDSYSFPCALMPDNLEFYILINKEIRTKLSLTLGQEVNIKLEKDTSKFGMPMPDSFRILLDQDEEGRNHFNKLTPGKQRSLIFIVKKVKNIDSQITKGLAILDHLKSNNGKLDFRMLGVTVKEYNQQSKYKKH